MKESNMIFVSSLPRSGSTLLQRLLGAYDSVHTESESWILLPMLDTNCELMTESVYGRNTAAIAVKDFYEGIDPKSADDLLKQYVLSLYQLKLPKGKEIFLDKTPRYYLMIEKIEALFPTAKHIYIKRNPLAVLASIYRSWAKDDIDSLLNYQVDLVDGVRILAEHTSKTENKVVSYESLISSPDTELADIQQYLGLNDSTLPLTYSALNTQWALGDQETVNANKAPIAAKKNLWVDFLSDEVLWDLLWHYLLSLDASLLGSLGYSAEELHKIMVDAREQYGHTPGNISIAGFNLEDFFSPTQGYKSKQSFFELRMANQNYADINRELAQQSELAVQEKSQIINEQVRSINAMEHSVGKLQHEIKLRDEKLQHEIKLRDEKLQHEIKLRDEKLQQEIKLRDEKIYEVEKLQHEIKVRDEKIYELEIFRKGIVEFWEIYKSKNVFFFFKIKKMLNDIVDFNE